MSDLTDQLASVSAEVRAAAARRSPLYQMLKLHSMSHILLELHQLALDNSDGCCDEGWMEAADKYIELAAELDEAGSTANFAERAESEQA